MYRGSGTARFQRGRWFYVHLLLGSPFGKRELLMRPEVEGAEHGQCCIHCQSLAMQVDELQNATNRLRHQIETLEALAQRPGTGYHY